MKAWLKKLLSVSLVFLQAGSLGTAILLEYLSDKKMGVSRYLVYKTEYYNAKFFNPEQLNFYQLVLAGGLLLCCWLIFVRRNNRQTIGSLLYIVLLVSVTMVFLGFKDLLQFKAYHFFVLSFIIMIMAEGLKFIITSFGETKCKEPS